LTVLFSEIYHISRETGGFVTFFTNLKEVGLIFDEFAGKQADGNLSGTGWGNRHGRGKAGKASCPEGAVCWTVPDRISEVKLLEFCGQFFGKFFPFAQDFPVAKHLEVIGGGDQFSTPQSIDKDQFQACRVVFDDNIVRKKVAGDDVVT
jgi:hypothetical protein